MLLQKLEKVKIEGFKSIRSLELKLQPLNILIGANGAGKSNFIDVFEFLNQILNENLQFYVAKKGGVDSILHFGRQTTEKLHLFFRFGDKDRGNTYECTLVPAENDRFIFESEVLDFHDRHSYPGPYRESLGKGHTETKLSNGTGIEKHVISGIKNWKIYHFHDTSDTARIKQTGDIDDNRFLRPDASNLAAYLYMLRETKAGYYDNIVDTIRLIAPFFDDFDLRPRPLNESKIKLEWKERGSDSYFDANSLSDGTLRFMSLATLLLQPEENMPMTILLDEPELGLHPYAITVLASLLQSTAAHTQIIASTQSVTLVNQFDPENIIIVEREERESIFRHLKANQIATWLDDYGLGDLWEKNVLGGRPTA